ncbi:MAG: hypothetical protein SFZ23_01775 [Planctomycetota bacterium]|nr:hypothetical protein [Planctomycetota bacterium]
MSEQFELDWKVLRERVGPYPREAYLFVRKGLAHTVRIVHGQSAAQAVSSATTHEHDAAHDVDDHEEPSDSRHVSGRQLCIGLRDHAVRQYGLLARTVLGRWNITSTEDFGRIVFGMIDLGLMRKTDEDSLDDFKDVYEFDEAFHSFSPSGS